VPPEAEETPRPLNVPEASRPDLSLEDFAAFLRTLSERGFEYVVIGGCAVGAYAALRGEELFSGDLDLLASWETLNSVLELSENLGFEVVKRSAPGPIPTAFLRWEGKEVNILVSSRGLPEPAEAVRHGRVFELREHGGFEVLIADPFDLLRNKLLLDRPKDRPHIEILRRFVEEEVVHAFEAESSPRERLAPARMLLRTTGSRALPEALSERLLPLARLPSDFRFLANNVPAEAQARALLARAGDPVLARELEGILARRELASG
jgi:hypothetical protein